MKMTASRSWWVELACLALLICGLVGARPAVAAATIDITGTLNPGTACTPELVNGQLNYGDIALSQLNKDKPTALESRTVTLRVSCAPLASKFFFRVIGSTTGVDLDHSLHSAAGVPDSERKLLGIGSGETDNRRPIGELFLKTTLIQADGQDKVLLCRDGGGNDTARIDWSARRSAFVWSVGGGYLYTVAERGSKAAAFAKVFTVRMDAIPVISPRAVDGLSADAKINSNFTIEMTQL